MPFLSFHDYPVWLNLLILFASALAIWFSGIRLERYADTIARLTGLGQALTGMLLLSVSTTLPELATSISAVLIPNPTLAVHNLLGGVVLQTAMLALADWVQRDRGALTYFSPHSVLLIEGVGLVILLQLALAGAAMRGFVSLWGVGLDTVLLMLTYLFMVYLTNRYQHRPRWIAAGNGAALQPGLPLVPEAEPSEPASEPAWENSLASLPETGPAGRRRGPPSGSGADAEGVARRVYWLYAGTSLVVLVGGWAVARSADALAVQTGIASSMIGATLVAAATSLPELSTTTSAARHGNYSMAISNIIGSNAYCVMLLFVSDVFYRKEPILRHAPSSVMFLAALGSVVTCVYLWGLLERENRTIGRLGWDSAMVVLLYVLGLVILYAHQ